MYSCYYRLEISHLLESQDQCWLSQILLSRQNLQTQIQPMTSRTWEDITLELCHLVFARRAEVFHIFWPTYNISYSCNLVEMPTAAALYCVGCSRLHSYRNVVNSADKTCQELAELACLGIDEKTTALWAFWLIDYFMKLFNMSRAFTAFLIVAVLVVSDFIILSYLSLGWSQ